MKSPMVFLGIAMALACANASAQNQVTPTSADTLAQEQGLTRVSNGLYARTSPTSVHYVAVNPAGMNALLQKLLELKARQPRPAAAGTPGVLDQLISDLSRPQAQVSQNGDCSGPGGTAEPQLSTTATSGGGTGSSSSAVLVSDFSPVTPTTNVARAEVDNGLGNTVSTQTSTTAASTPANASAYSAAGCTAFASSTVTCPGHTSPSVASFATSQKQVPHGSCAL